MKANIVVEFAAIRYGWMSFIVLTAADALNGKVGEAKMDREKVIKGLKICTTRPCYCTDCPYKKECCLDSQNVMEDALALLKEQEAARPKTIPEELKLKMWNALYAKEDKFEENYIGTKEQNSWFLIYRPWLQEGFDLAIKAIADWESR